MVYVHIVMFLTFQIIANLFFKWGASNPAAVHCSLAQEYWGFILGNIVGVTSIIFMIGMYKALPAASVVAIGTGGTFLLVQIVMYLLYRERLSLTAIGGIILIFAGIMLVALCNQPAAAADDSAATQNHSSK